MKVHRTYTTRLKVTRRQDRTLTALLAQLCELYNMALQQRQDAYKSCGKQLSKYDQMRELTQLREAYPDYAASPVTIQRDPLRRLAGAFSGFFRRLKCGEKPGYPRYRSPGRYDSFSVDSYNFKIEGDGLSIVKLGTFRFKTQRRMQGKPVALRVKRCGRKWQVGIVCDLGLAPEKVAVSSAIGIDVGLTSLVTLSDGGEIDNPRWTKHEAERLATANQSLSRKVRGSLNRQKAKERVRRCHQRIQGKRRAYLHDVSASLVRTYDLIAYEKLNIRGMAQSRLAKSILDAAWHELLWQITYKAESAGKYAVAVNPRGTTQTCSGCGTVVKKGLSQRWHSCPECGRSLGRDHNAALNILRLGTSHVGTSAEGSVWLGTSHEPVTHERGER